MVRLRTYDCHNCHNVCKPFLFGKMFNPGFCGDCGRVTCGECQWKFEQSTESDTFCPVTYLDCDYIVRFDGVLDYLNTYAPEDEMKLLKHGKWSPFWCHQCWVPITSQRPLGFIDKQRCICVHCLTPATIANMHPVHTVMKIIDEVEQYFADDNDYPVRRGRLQLSTLKCDLCNKPDSFRFISDAGQFLCAKCKDGVKHYDLAYVKIGLYFYKFRLYIPHTSDLRLLTYSKWTPLRCDKCAVPFSSAAARNPYFHPDCYAVVCSQCAERHDCKLKGGSMIRLNFLIDICKEFRRFFNARTHVEKGGMPVNQQASLPTASRTATPVKNTSLQDASCTATPVNQQTNLQEASRTSTPVPAPRKMVNTPQPYTQIARQSYEQKNEMRDEYRDVKSPAESQDDILDYYFENKMIKCVSCNALKHLAELRTCLTCEMYGLCVVCIREKHWIHKKEKSGLRTHTAFVQSEHSKTLNKLVKWKGKLDSLTEQGNEAQKNLCDSYGELYSTALSSDPMIVKENLQSVDLKQMERTLEDFVFAQNKLNASIQSMCEEISDLRNKFIELSCFPTMHLKSYECHYCDMLCKPHYFGELFNPGLCVNCGRFACGECQYIFKIEHPERKPSCVKGKEECDYITRFFGVLDYLHEFAPDDELLLLDLEKWSPFWCHRCKGTITQERPLGFINKLSCFCVGCSRPNAAVYPIERAAIITVTKLINEVRSYFSDVNVPGSNVKSPAMYKRAKKLFLLQSMKCKHCERLDSFRYISKAGDFVCAKCIETKNIAHCDLAFNKIGLNFYNFRIYISNPNDLKLLTYSKWSPLKCEDCSNHFTVKGNPHFHTSCYKIICKQCTGKHQCAIKDAQMLPLNFLIDMYKEFLCYFRDCPPTLDLHKLRNKALAPPNEPNQTSLHIPNRVNSELYSSHSNLNSDSEPEPVRPLKTTVTKRILQFEQGSASNNTAVNQITVRYPTYPVLQERETNVVPNKKLEGKRKSANADERRTCANCSGVVDVKAFHLCITCPMNCVCQDCIIIHHWNLGHQIQKTGPAVFSAVASSEHSKIVNKMENWKRRLDNCYKQGADANKTLHTTFNNLYTTAMRANPWRNLPYAKLEQLEQTIENTINAQAAFIELIGTLGQRCASLGASLSGTANAAIEEDRNEGSHR